MNVFAMMELLMMEEDVGLAIIHVKLVIICKLGIAYHVLLLECL